MIPSFMPDVTLDLLARQHDMPWPDWLGAAKDKSKDERLSAESLKDLVPSAEALQAEIQSLKNAATNNSLNTATLCALSSASTLAVVLAYLRLRKLTRRVTLVGHGALQHKSLYGFVPKVGDGDGFRFYHTPGGIAQGWGWLPGRQPRKMEAKDFAKNTLSIRLAAVDAPEMAHFGKEAQPYSEEAIQWLRKAVEGRYVRIFPYRKDQYDRLVCEAETKRFILLRTNIGLEMVKNGLATVYEAKFGGEFGDKKQQYEDAEQDAKAKGRGMWHEPGVIARLLGEKAKPVETPRQYKTRTAADTKPHKKA